MYANPQDLREVTRNDSMMSEPVQFEEMATLYVRYMLTLQGLCKNFDKIYSPELRTDLNVWIIRAITEFR